MDSIDAKILDIIQTRFPLDSRPYAVLGQELGLSEQDAFDRVMNLKKSGVIRRIGANFQSHKLGWRSTLCGASVPEEKLEHFIQEINKLPGVTHNYIREHTYNVWFTYIGESWDNVLETLKTLTATTGVSILNLPADKLFKIQLNFAMEE